MIKLSSGIIKSGIIGIAFLAASTFSSRIICVLLGLGDDNVTPPYRWNIEAHKNGQAVVISGVSDKQFELFKYHLENERLTPYHSNQQSHCFLPAYNPANQSLAYIVEDKEHRNQNLVICSSDETEYYQEYVVRGHRISSLCWSGDGDLFVTAIPAYGLPTDTEVFKCRFDNDLLQLEKISHNSSIKGIIGRANEGPEIFWSQSEINHPAPVLMKYNPTSGRTTRVLSGYVYDLKSSHETFLISIGGSGVLARIEEVNLKEKSRKTIPKVKNTYLCDVCYLDDDKLATLCYDPHYNVFIEIRNIDDGKCSMRKILFEYDQANHSFTPILSEEKIEGNE